MTKLFVLSNATHRLRNDFFPCGTLGRRHACSVCGANQNRWNAPLQYWWEYEFGDPQASVDAGHHCFWGEFRLMVDQVGKSLLQQLTIPFEFHPCVMTKGDPLEGQESLTLTHVAIDTFAEADPVESKNAVCANCGTFTQRRRAITRLRVHASDIPEFGLFKIRQNGDSSPLFVSEEGREMLTATGISGMGFYPAGRVI